MHSLILTLLSFMLFYEFVIVQTYYIKLYNLLCIQVFIYLSMYEFWPLKPSIFYFFFFFIIIILCLVHKGHHTFSTYITIPSAMHTVNTAQK